MATELQNLTKIFNTRLFRIPDYQRGYAWGDRQLTDFWSDLQRVGTDRIHYCGQLTLEKADEAAWKQWEHDKWLVEDAGYESYFVVDGQQRLTTSIIVLQCLLENMTAEEVIAGQKVSELRERYLVKGNGLLRSCLFGYARDNPSHEFFRTQVLGVPSNEYTGARTIYTANLGYALDYFRKRLSEASAVADRERLLKALTQRFRFNLYELTNDIDVFVAFETMNNRGKPLSRLELLKNRLIYLSTLANGSDAERNKVRANINSVWRTIYEELGRQPTEALDDDEFLRAHWIVFFGYDKDEADPLTQFLLNRHFTSERLDSGDLTLNDIQKYVDSLQVSARVWQQLHFPEVHAAELGAEVAAALIRLKRLGFGVLRPVLLVSLSHQPQQYSLIPLLNQSERFLLLVRSIAITRSHIGEADSYRMAHDIVEGKQMLSDAVQMLKKRVDRDFSIEAFQDRVNDLFKDDDGKGFYEMPGLKFLLFEYEEELRSAAKAATGKIVWENFRGVTNSVEHIYPQGAENAVWPEFAQFGGDQLRYLLHSLGNLVAVSVAKNASLSRSSFKDKKKGTDKIPGFSQGSFSELRIAQKDDWNAQSILNRGIDLLKFIEKRWNVNLGDDDRKRKLLRLDFLPAESS